MGATFHIFYFRADMLIGILGLFHQLPTSICKLHRASGTMYQLDAQCSFQLGDTLADGSLADMKPLCGSSKAALLREDDQAMHMSPEAFALISLHNGSCFGNCLIL